MAVKFSQFNVASTIADIDYLVGYKSTDNVQIPVGLVGSDTTYTVSTAQSGANELITLTGSDASTDSITITAGTDISLTDDGSGNGFTISSTATGDTYTLSTSTNGSSVDVNLDAAVGTDSAITLTPGTGISITQAANVATITNTAPGDTYTLSAGTKVGSSVPLNLDAAIGSDSVVNLTEGAGITLTQTSATEVTISGASGSVIYVDSFTGDGSTLTFTASQTIDSENDTQVFIDGVNQSKSTYSTSGTSLIFTTAPPLGSNIELTNISAVSLVSVPDGVITTAKFSSGTLVTESEGIVNNDNDLTIPTSAAVKDYVDVGVSVISTDTTAVSGNLYVFTANLTLTLPLSPSVGNYVKFSNRSGVATCVIARNGENIMGVASDLTIDKLDTGLELIYTGAAQGWVLIGIEGI